MNAVYANADFQNVILTVLALVVILVIVGCIYTFIRAIIMFIFSHSKEENKKKGWNSIRFMIIGVILTIVLLFLIPVVLKRMKVPKYDVYSPTNIFSRAGELITGLFSLGNVIKQSQQNSQYRGELYDGNVDSSANGQIPEPITSNQYSL
jgi:formate hydrogenlyase subunit 3/multisubunit Na+/H+ antiporter MnhD subunit